MKGIVGVNAQDLKAGDEIERGDGWIMTIVRKVDLAAAKECAARLGDHNFRQVEGEQFYEVQVTVPIGPRN
jgi:hypothetical protein